MKKLGMFIASAMLAATVSANASEITCFGKDGVGTTFIVQLTDFVNDKAGGTLYVQAGSGPSVSLGDAGMQAAKGKVTYPDSSNWNNQLYIEGRMSAREIVFLNLEKSGRASYEGEFCGPHNNINIGGVQFTQNDCLQVQCKSNGLSKIRAY